MLPMKCPSCRDSRVRAVITNGLINDQIVRKRACESCGHSWFTVEVQVPSYAVGWSTYHQRKPVLRVPVDLEIGHTRLRVSHEEAKDQIALLREANARRAAEAEARYRM